VLREVDDVYVIDFQTMNDFEANNRISTLNPLLTVITPIGSLIDLIPKTHSGALVGISLAFDLNEINSESEHENMNKWLARLNGVVLDSAFTHEKLIKEFHYKGLVHKTIYGIREFEGSYSPPTKESLKKIIVTRTWTTLHNNDLALEAFLELPLSQNFSISFIEPSDTLKKFDLIQRINQDAIGVSLLKPMRNLDVRKELRAHGLYISTSLSDGTSISLLEAMELERVCLVSDFPSNKEIVDHGQNGFLFKNGDKSDLVRQIQEIQGLSDSEIKRIGMNARLRVQEIANWKQNSQNLLEFWRMIMERTNW
jgi:glycosyltransferase involved in cell wall biosynthesis